MLETIGRQWWVIALRGLFAVLFGVIALAWPGMTIAALVILFGIYVFIDGVVAIIAAWRMFGEHGRWWPAFIVGALGVIVGLFAFFAPTATATALVYLVAFWAIITGIFEIVAAMHLRRHMGGEWLLAVGGAISILLGVVLYTRPAIGLIAMSWIIAFYALFFGVLLLVLGFRMRSLGPGANLRMGTQL